MIVRVWDVTFTTTDLDRAADFYEKVLGLTKKYQFSNYVGLDCGGVEIGLQPGTPATGEESGPIVGLLVQDIDQAHRELRDRGVRFLKEPHDTPWGGRIALLADPDGNLLQLVQIDWPEYLNACAPR